LIGSGISIILVLVFALIVYVSFNRVAEENERELIANEIHTTVSELNIIMHDYMTYREERMVEQWNLKYGVSLEIIEKADYEELETIKANYADLKTLFSQITADYEKQGSSELEERRVSQFLIKSHTIIFDSSTIAKEAYNNAIEAQKTANTSMLIAFIVLFVVLVAVSLSIERLITKPLSKLAKGTEIIGKGNLKYRLDIKSKGELGELAAAFNKAAEALEGLENERKQLEKAKTEFLSITSHELRSPMTPMKGQLQMLMKGYFGSVNAKQKKSLDIVLRNTDRLDRIIIDLLEVSRLEAARLKFRFVKADLTPYVNRLVKEMQGFLPEKNIEIITKIGKLPIIEVDPDRVMQVLRNLLNNAKKFSSEHREIRVGVVTEGERVLFSVRDSGIGVAPQSLRKVFEPFFQEEQTLARKYGGTGLGLSICRGIVESQNGRIWAESKLGKGSTFYFTVPLQPVREIKPIKLLFSAKEDVEKKIKAIFIDYLGPLGESEFDMLKKKGLRYEFIMSYMNELREKGIIAGNVADTMIVALRDIYGVKPKKAKGFKK